IRVPGNEIKLPLIPERPEPWSILVADAATGQAKEVWHSGMKMEDSFPDLTADISFQFPTNDRLVFASEQDGRNHLYSIAVAGGQPTLLTPGQFDVEDVTLSADRRSLIYSSNQDDVDRRHLWRVNVDGGAPQAITHGATMEWTPAETGNGSYVVCLGST